MRDENAELDLKEREELGAILAGAEARGGRGRHGGSTEATDYLSPGIVTPVRTRHTPFPAVQPWYKRAIALRVSGFDGAEICEILGKSQGAVSAAIRHPDLQAFKHELADQVARETVSDARGILAEHTSEAAHSLVEHMRSETESISLRATESILDRGGVPKQELVSPPSLRLDRGEANDIRTALLQMIEPAEVVEDVDGTSGVLHEALAQSNGHTGEVGTLGRKSLPDEARAPGEGDA